MCGTTRTFSVTQSGEGNWPLPFWPTLSRLWRGRPRPKTPTVTCQVPSTHCPRRLSREGSKEARNPDQSQWRSGWSWVEAVTSGAKTVFAGSASSRRLPFSRRISAFTASLRCSAPKCLG
jgi:hypothetical protein